jgi:hypothetical protein
VGTSNPASVQSNRSAFKVAGKSFVVMEKRAVHMTIVLSEEEAIAQHPDAFKEIRHRNTFMGPPLLRIDRK